MKKSQDVIWIVEKQLPENDIWKIFNISYSRKDARWMMKQGEIWANDNTRFRITRFIRLSVMINKTLK